MLVDFVLFHAAVRFVDTHHQRQGEGGGGEQDDEEPEGGDREDERDFLMMTSISSEILQVPMQGLERRSYHMVPS